MRQKTLAARFPAVAVAYVLSALLVLFSGAAAYRNLYVQEETTREVLRTAELGATLNRIEAGLTEAQSAARGYLVTGQPSFLSSHEGLLAEPTQAPPPAELQKLLDHSRELLANDASQRARLKQLQILVDETIAWLRRLVRLYADGETEVALDNFGTREDQRLMEAFRVELQAMREEQRKKLALLREQREDAAERALLSGIAVTLLALAALIGLLVVSIRAARRQARSEQRFRSLVEASSSVVWSIDRHHAMRVPNESWARFTGQSGQEYRGTGWINAVHPADRAGLEQVWELARRRGADWQARCRIRRRDGQYRDMAMHGVPVRNRAGEVQEWVGTCTDVTELLQAQERMRRLAESGAVGIVFGDRHGAIDYANDEFLRIVGYDQADLEAGRLRWDALTPPEWHETEARQIADAQRTGASGRFEKEFIRKDGSRVPVMIGFVLLGEAREQSAAFAIDLSEQKRAEETLRQREEDFRTLADNMSQLAWMTDADGSIVWYNRRWFEYTGTTIEEMRGWGWRAVHHPDHVDRVVSKISDCFAKGQPWEDTFPLRGADGRYRWFLSRALPIRDDSGRIVRWFGTNTDITDLRELEEELKESNRQKDDFIATLAHELRNPLAPIRTGLDLLKLLPPDAPRAASIRDTMERQVAYLVRLIDDLLDISRINRGKLELKKEQTTVQAVVNAALETSQPHIAAGKHELELDLPEQALGIRADSMRMAQVVANVLNNAAKYTPEGGRITLRAQREGGVATITVTDTGIGIPQELLGRVFEMFMQVDGPGTSRQGGLGIGLPLARRLVEMHGGTISGESAGAGQGSRFTIRLPMADAATTASATKHEQAGTSGHARMKVLVVDDNEDAAAMLAAILQVMGHHVRVAHDGAQALDLARSFGPQLAFLDIGMPDMTGFEVARAMRALPGGSGMFLVALTGWGGAADIQRSMEAGFDRHLVKPATTDAVRAVMAAAQQPS